MPNLKNILSGLIETDSKIIQKVNNLSANLYLSGQISGTTSGIGQFKVNNLSSIIYGSYNSIIPTPADLFQINIGLENTVSGLLAYAHGKNNNALGRYSVADGYKTITSGQVSHAEGSETKAYGKNSHAQGNQSQSIGIDSHAQGRTSHATGLGAHSEGNSSVAAGQSSHAQGMSTQAGGMYSHTEGQQTHTSNRGAHAEGLNTYATGQYQHVEGKYNIAITQDYQHIVGGGTSDSNRKNIQTLDWSGNLWNAGIVSGSDFIINNSEIKLSKVKDYIDDRISAIISGAPSALDTLKQIADALSTHHDIISGLIDRIQTKQNILNTTNKLNSDYISGTLIDKVNTIEEGAQVNTLTGIIFNGSKFQPDETKIITLSGTYYTKDQSDIKFNGQLINNCNIIENNVNISPMNNQVYKIQITSNALITFNTDLLTNNYQINFKVKIIELNTLYAVDFSNNVIWIGATPTFTTANTIYCIKMQWDGQHILAWTQYEAGF